MSFASVTGSLPPFPANASGSLTNDGDGHLSWIENGPSDYAADLLSGQESTGGVPYQVAPSQTLFAVGTSGQVLKSNGTSAPTWVDQSTLSVGSATKSTNLVGGAIGYMPYQSAADTTLFIANGTAGQVLTSNGGAAPSWTNAPVDFKKITYSITLTSTQDGWVCGTTIPNSSFFVVGAPELSQPGGIDPGNVNGTTYNWWVDTNTTNMTIYFNTSITTNTGLSLSVKFNVIYI